MLTKGRYYRRKRLRNPKSLERTIRRLRYQMRGKLTPDNYILQRPNKPEVLYLFHISWGDESLVRRYKLFRYNWD